MPAWTTITNALVAVGAKPFATTIQALRDNPIAIAEGQPGAPRVLGKALGSTFLAHQSVTGTNPATWTGLAGMETISVDFAFGTISNANNTIQIRFSSDNGSTYGAYQDFVTNSTGATQAGSGKLRLNLRTGQYSSFVSYRSDTASPPFNQASGTLTVPAGCNAFQIRMRDAGSSFVGMAWCFGGLEA